MPVVTGAASVVSLAVPEGPDEWPGCVAFLFRLRDAIGELAELLASRVAVPEGSDCGG
ncbi:hypothetical protein [Amycolatopsis sp. cmx-8-4]|uniref:hypothetical protein n=1 Tax=Amycolatopsis sp. cmx-8-4 TaxID=2790947 RepID=UPI0039784A94